MTARGRRGTVGCGNADFYRSKVDHHALHETPPFSRIRNPRVLHINDR